MMERLYSCAEMEVSLEMYVNKVTGGRHRQLMGGKWKLDCRRVLRQLKGTSNIIEIHVQRNLEMMKSQTASASANKVLFECWKSLSETFQGEACRRYRVWVGTM